MTALETFYETIKIKKSLFEIAIILAGEIRKIPQL